MKTVTKRNGKMTKREIIRAMYVRAMQGDSSQLMCFASIKRSLDIDDDATMIRFMTWMKNNTFINCKIAGRNILFCA